MAHPVGLIIRSTVILAMLCLIGDLGGCGEGEKGKETPAAAGHATSAGNELDPKTAFARYYNPITVECTPQVPGYELPLHPRDICNARDVLNRWLDPKATEVLLRNGLVVTDRGWTDDILAIYEAANDQDVPVIVTADTVLHLYHLQFDESLKGIEEREFSPALIDFTRAMLEASAAQERALTGDLQEAARRNTAFFQVARYCLEPSADRLTTAEVGRELELIDGHAGFARSPIFKYQEDYSQYLPRGHYTRSETLRRYFKAMMWYGRMAMLLKGESGGGMIPDADAKIQTLQAALIARHLYSAEGKALLDTWRRIYAVTAFYVGFADDLTPTEYHQALEKVAGAAYQVSALADEDTLFKLKSELATYRAPKIYGGTGELTLMPPFSPEQLDKVLEATKGMRLMGQRFVPDAYMMQNLIFPRAGAFTGTGKPFTMEDTAGGPQRAFARGLDVLAVLGSQRALEILAAEGDTAYANYDRQMAQLREEFGKLSAAEWNRTLYTSWLYALQALVQPPGAGYPTFMQGTAYQDRSLWAALASWTQLRHDTILYAKQPYTPRAGAAPPGEELPPPPGYVEPLPEFYARLLALTRMTRTGLQDMRVLDEPAADRLSRLESIIANLLRISQVELRNEPISQQDADYIKWVGNALKACIEGIQENEDKTTLVADVLTDTNSGQCLQEGVGYVKVLAAAYRLPDGRIAVGVGPVMSHYEFKQPIAHRLTDEAWRQLLRARPPQPAAWTSSFYVPAGTG